jgi:hypothetical protein
MRSALELGYYGANLGGFIHLICGEAGWLAGEDPDQLLVMGAQIKVESQRLLPAAFISPLDNAIDKIHDYLAEEGALSERDWHEVDALAKRVSSRVDSCGMYLSVLEAQALRAGIMTERVYLSTDQPTLKTLDVLESEAGHVLSDSGNVQLAERLAATRTALTSGETASLTWNRGLYGLVERDLRHSLLRALTS